MLCRMAKDLETGVDMDSAASTPTYCVISLMEKAVCFYRIDVGSTPP